ncbi:phosphorylase [Sphaerisporangium album]|uniref:Uridine phosphorylase n=1 Tax=Sphaerisporangium album TaxID=509200 RepID=A0A367EIJ4_9ACTN|nr:nucleoside phosphorylase [Sphaerisporangium album]RCG17916.1 phosphorylase [Sphaerisporangium album]
MPYPAAGPRAAARYPHFPDKYAQPAVIDPDEHAAYVRARHGATSLHHLHGVVLVYQGALLRHLRSTETTQTLQGWVSGELHLLERTKRRVGVCGGFGLGAPAAAMVAEQLIALGVRCLITVGTAGAVAPDIAVGEVVVCRQAIRDEGLSHHYLPPGTYAHPCRSLTDRLAAALHTHHVTARSGVTWTIDAPYRETVAEVRYYQRHGVATVDMEAAAIFAVAEYRKVAAAAAFAISDTVADTARQPRQASPATQHALQQLLAAAVTTLDQPAPNSPRRTGRDRLRRTRR